MPFDLDNSEINIIFINMVKTDSKINKVKKMREWYCMGRVCGTQAQDVWDLSPMSPIQ